MLLLLTVCQRLGVQLFVKAKGQNMLQPFNILNPEIIVYDEKCEVSSSSFKRRTSIFDCTICKAEYVCLIRNHTHKYGLKPYIQYGFPTYYKDYS